MKNKRQIAKEETRELIIQKTKELIIFKGIINTSTKQISDYCKLAHGTLFSHFSNREELFGSVIKHELIRIARQIKNMEIKNNSFFELLEMYLNLISEEEPFLARLYKEFPFINDELQREVITTESIVKKLFYESIEDGIKKQEFKNADIQSTLSFLFGAIQFYLVRKEFMSDTESIIKTKKRNIVTTMSNILNQ